MRRSTVIAASVLALVIVGLFGWRATADRGTTELSADFESSVGLYTGSDVQVLGVPVGTVTDVAASESGVKVTMKLDRDVEVAADTDAVIVAPTLVSDRFVQLTKPYTQGQALKAGAKIPRERTAVPVEIDQLYASLTAVGEELGPNGLNKDGALGSLLTTAQRNLQGQGTKINQLLDDLGQASGTLADSGDDLFATVTNVKEFTDMLAANDTSVASVNRQLAEVSDYLADDSDDLAAAVQNMGEALAIVDDFIRDNRGDLTTSVEKLQAPTRVLVDQKKALEEAVRTIPLVLQNFLRAYDSDGKALTGRGNLNEASIWSEGDAPTLLPGVDQ